MNKYMTALAVLLVASAACSSSNNTGGGFTDDAPAADTPSGGGDGGADSSTTPPRDAAADRPAGNDAAADRPATPDTGTGTGGGTCGAATVQALCTCGMDANCQTTAVNRNMACAQCVGQAQLGCCPMQGMRFNTCIQDNMCADQACVQTNCAMQAMALQTCFMTAQQSNMACQEMLAGCFGEFPIMCVGM